MSWRDRITKEFTPHVSRLTLVADPDGLLTEEGVIAGIAEKGFELVAFEDNVSFRFIYESKYRRHWDRGGRAELVVVLGAGQNSLREMPFDLQQAGRTLSFSLGELFPELNYHVIAALDRGDLDALFAARGQFRPRNLSESATKDFVLSHVFGVAPELIKDEADLLRALLRLHYRSLRLPPAVAERLVQLLRRNPLFALWPLGDIVPRREAFFGFLQEHWTPYLDRSAAEAGGAETGVAGADPASADGRHRPDTLSVPFGHEDVRIYIDNLFLEGMLRPVPHNKAATLSSRWVRVGLEIDPTEDRLRRLSGLAKTVSESVPGAEARHQEWLAFAPRWAELTALRHGGGDPIGGELLGKFQSLEMQIDSAFSAWVLKKYGGLYNQPAMPPVMVHHVPRALARGVADSTKGRVALVVMDGLALDQWIVLREQLRTARPGWQFEEGAVFAWLPTITSVSRQAIFAGQPPVFFPESLATTDKEPALWNRFWLEHGLNKNEVAYRKGLGDDPTLATVEEALADHRVRALGLVVDKVDRIMHGMELGAIGMHDSVRRWSSQGFMTRLLDLLFEESFNVYVTADHGNIEATGWGRPAEGAVADYRGERVRVFNDQTLRARIRDDFPPAVEWPPHGLPDNYLALLAPAHYAFISEGETRVVHGAISVEELIVPFIRINRGEHG